jgi:hypothetical protein
MRQFRVCRSCGRGFDGPAPKSHTKPWGSKCSGTFEVVDLVYRFETDTLQIRFDGLNPSPPLVSDSDFWLSFETAFTVAAAEVLVIPPRDIDGTYRSQDNSLCTIASPVELAMLPKFSKICLGYSKEHYN